MARRLHGDVTVKRRHGGGVVLTIHSATGEAFEIERTSEQVADLRSCLDPVQEEVLEQDEAVEEMPQEPNPEPGAQPSAPETKESSDA